VGIRIYPENWGSTFFPNIGVSLPVNTLSQAVRLFTPVETSHLTLSVAKIVPMLQVLHTAVADATLHVFKNHQSFIQT
jgi:hypothetical protein